MEAQSYMKNPDLGDDFMLPIGRDKILSRFAGILAML